MTEPIDFLRETLVGQAVRNAVRQRDRERHQFRRLVASVTEHKALVAGADVFRVGRVDALRDVRALTVERDHDGAGFRVNAVFVVGVADAFDGAADDLLIVELRFRRDFARDDGQTGRRHRFASDAAHRVLRQAGVENAVRNAVGEFVRVAHADGFAGEISFRHWIFVSLTSFRRAN